MNLCKTCSEHGHCPSPCSESLKVVLHNDSDYKKEKLKQDKQSHMNYVDTKKFNDNRPLDFS